MKSSNIGIVAVAILLVVAGFDFGIAQAGGIHSEQPVLSFEDMEAIDLGSSSSSYVETRPVLAFEDSSSPYADRQMENPIETGSLPDKSNSGSSIVETEGDMYRSGEDTGGP